MKTYHGIRSIGTIHPTYVTVIGDDGVARPLEPPSWQCGFNWGADARRRYRAQRIVFELGADHLARVLLADATGDDVAADKHCQAFKESVVRQFDDGWSLTDADVRDWLLSVEKETAARQGTPSPVN